MNNSITIKSDDIGVLSRAHRKLEKHLRRWPAFIWLCVLPLLILSLLTTYVWLANQVFLSEGELVRSTDKLVYWQGQPVLINLTPTIDDLEQSHTSMPLPADVLVALDVSGSMGSADRAGDPYHDAIGVVRKISKLLYGANANIGFISFDDQAILEVPLASEKQTFYRSLSTPKGGGGTDIAAALRLALDQFSNTSTRGSKLLVLVTDGEADIDRVRQLARQAQTQNVHIIGLGIGPQAIPFFDDALSLGDEFEQFHFSMEWLDNDDEIFQGLQHILVQGALGLLTSIGDSPELTEYPHLGALPIYDEIPDDLFSQMGIESQRLFGAELKFSSFYFLNTPHFYSYVLKADALGIHPVALDQAILSYRQANANGTNTVEQFSGGSPRILVISPLLLLLLYIPALGYLLYMLTQRKHTVRLMLPSALPKLATRSKVSELPSHQFRLRSLQVKKPRVNDEHIPTLIISVGASAGELLAALLRAVDNTGHRVTREGVYTLSDDVYPIHMDCSVLEPGKQPKYRDWQLDKNNVWTLYDHSQPNLLSTLLTELRDNPAKHPAANWFDSQAFGSHGPDIANGCGGNRQLARLLVYLDLLKPEPMMHKLRNDVAKWMHNFPTGQIFVLASPEEDISSAWPLDIAYHIRKELGPRSVPMYLFMGQAATRLQSPADLGSLNAKACKAELSVMQNAAGLPISGMDRVNDRVVNDANIGDSFSTQQSGTHHPAVLLPLFDRVFSISNNGQAASSALSAQVLVELMDATVKRAVAVSLADNAWRFRSGRYRSQASELHAASGFISRIDASVFHLPIVLWRKLWSLYAIRDSLMALLNLESQDDSFQLKGLDQYVGHEADLWPEIASSGLFRPLSCLPLLNRVNEGLRTSGKFSPLDVATKRTIGEASIEALGRELMALVSAYLNGDACPSELKQISAWLIDRQQRFAKVLCLLTYWKDGLEKSHAIKDGPRDTVSQALHFGINNALDNLHGWSQALFEVNAKASPAPLLRQVLEDIRVLHDQLPEAQTEDGISSPALDKWLIKPTEFYQQKIAKRLIDEAQLLKLFKWRLDPNNTQLELQFQHDSYRLVDMASSKLQRRCYEVLETNLLTEYFAWTIDDCLSIEHFPMNLDIDSQGNTVVFHGCQLHENVKAIHDNSALINTTISTHGYHDRIAYIGVRENVYESEQSLVGPSSHMLPLVQPFATNVRTLDTSLRRLSNHSLPLTSLPERQLFAQNMSTIEMALMVWLSGHLQYVQLRNAPQWVLQQKTQAAEVTAIGESSKTRAMKQIFFKGHSLAGSKLELDAVKTAWWDFPYEERQSRITVFIDEFEQQCTQEDQQSGWPYLLLAKAHIDVCNNSGLLA